MQIHRLRQQGFSELRKLTVNGGLSIPKDTYSIRQAAQGSAPGLMSQGYRAGNIFMLNCLIRNRLQCRISRIEDLLPLPTDHLEDSSKAGHRELVHKETVHREQEDNRAIHFTHGIS
jgi:hypothetical protein